MKDQFGFNKKNKNGIIDFKLKDKLGKKIKMLKLMLKLRKLNTIGKSMF